MMKYIVTFLFIGWLPQCLLVSSLNTSVHITSGNDSVKHSVMNTLNTVERVHNISGISLNLQKLALLNIPITNKTDTKNGSGFQNSSSAQQHPLLCNVEKTNQTFHANMSCYPPSAPLQCFHDPIFCKKHFTSGKRELGDERPTYGEYSSLKHQFWFRVIQHGGIAFLFHPCTEESEVAKLRQVASQCLHRHVLAPYDKLTETRPLALVSWGCFYISTRVNTSQMRSWIRKHAYSGPASHVHTDGKFQDHLVKQSEVLTDEKDAILCPNEEQKYLFTPVTSTELKKVTYKLNPESIINNRIIKLNKLKQGIEITANVTVTKIETGSAVWAAASLIFLCGILVGWLVYTRQWSRVGEYKYDPLRNKDSFECEPGKSQFNLLKSSQKFMSAFRWKEEHQKKEDAMSKVNLMVPINEVRDDDDDDDVIFQR